MTAPQDPFTPPPADRTPNEPPARPADAPEYGSGPASGSGGSSRIGGEPSTADQDGASVRSTPPTYGADQTAPGYGGAPTPQSYGSQPGYGGAPPPPGYGSTGTAPAYGPGSGPPAGYGARPRNGLGIAALVLGILSILTSIFFGFGMVFAIPAIVLGVLGRGRAKRREATNAGVATAGLITGVIGALLSALVIALTIAGANFLFNTEEGQTLTQCIEDAGDNQAAVEQCGTDLENQVTR